MTELYWIFVLGALSDILPFVAVIVLFASTLHEDKKISRRMFIISVILGVFALFIPPKKDLLIIYGVGETIDYIQSNDEAKKLPDNCIKAVNKFVKDYINE